MKIYICIASIIAASFFTACTKDQALLPSTTTDSATSMVVELRDGDSKKGKKENDSNKNKNKKDNDSSKGNDNSSSQYVLPANLPTAVKNYVAANYAGYTIVKAESKTKSGVAAYEVKLTKGATTIELTISAAGAVLKTEQEGNNHSGNNDFDHDGISNNLDDDDDNDGIKDINDNDDDNDGIRDDNDNDDDNDGIFDADDRN
jgi:hypothetical protein